MHEIWIDVDTKNGFHPPKVVIRKDGKTLIDMPADEFVGWVQAVQLHQEECRACEVPGCHGRCPNCNAAHHVGLCPR